MEQKQQQTGNLSRREFVRGSAIGAAGLAAGLSAIPSAEAQAQAKAKAKAQEAEIRKTRSYNPEMEYKQLGNTGLWVSAVALGGHWKRLNVPVPGLFQGNSWLSANLDDPGFKKNRYEVVSRCIERGINTVDACTRPEVLAYAEALKGRRDAFFFGFSWYEEELRRPEYRSPKALLATLDKGMKLAGLDFVDWWRPTMSEQSGRHTKEEVDWMMEAMRTAKQQGKIRFGGASTHDRPHIAWMIETYPDIFKAISTPFTARTKVKPKDSLFEIAKKTGAGLFGIKPFSENALFKGTGALDDPNAAEDDRLARLTIRYILATDAITAPIPGLINTHQVDNVADAVKERRKLDMAETKDLEEAMDRAWANLRPNHQFLKDWEYV